MSSTRSGRLSKYLVGDGLLSKIPTCELWFYRLAGECGHESWPLNPADWKPRNSKCDERCELEPDTLHSGDDTEEAGKEPFFRPKSSLPAPVYRQTYRIWKSTMDMNLEFRQIRRRRTIYIQPLDEFPDFFQNFVFSSATENGFFILLQNFMKVFFMGINVELLPTISISKWKVTERLHKLTGQKQLLVDDLHKGLASILARGGQAIIGVTWTDLYPSADLNFVLGQASVKHRSAVVCFGRFETKVYESGSIPPPIDNIDGSLIYKMIKVIAHETCHIFCMSHCVFFNCLMNESTSVSEAVSQPLFLCPVCMRKLQKVCRFNIVDRYCAIIRLLNSVYNEYPSSQLGNSIDWLSKFLEWARNQSANS